MQLVEANGKFGVSIAYLYKPNVFAFPYFYLMSNPHLGLDLL